MTIERRTLFGLPLLVFGLFASFNVGAAEPSGTQKQVRQVTVQSELDYLRDPKRPLSIELKQATIKQAYDRIAKQAGLSISYEGGVNAESKHDVSFKHSTLKDVLGKLGEKFGLAYRVDGPDKLTVIGAALKSS
jgi:hypothetical protein